MKMKETVDPFVPRAPKQHALFGERFIRNHFFLDNKWTPNSRVAQYRCMVDLLEKQKAFGSAERLNNKRKLARALNLLKKECSDGRTKLRTAAYGDYQRIRNILRKHKELARLYQRMPLHMITDNINQRTFVKRKEQDRLLFKKSQMIEKYENSLLELSRLQDQIKYEDELILPDEKACKTVRMELKNSETRIRALKTIARAYGRIRTALYQDAIYYGPVLNSLQADINEQANFIKKIIHVGRPALGQVANLIAEYDILEDNTRKSLQERLSNLLAARQKISSNVPEMRKLVRKDGDFEVFPHRYDRETPSMTDLKNNLEDIEKVMKEVKQVTLCARAREVYPRMKKQILDNQQLKTRIENNQIEKGYLHDKNLRADIMIEALKYNVSDASNARKDKIKELEKAIAEQKVLFQEKVDFLKRRGRVMCYLRYSIHQIADTLRHVSDSLLTSKREYPIEDLKLPLLKFSAYPPKAFPPRPLEPSPDRLLRGIKERIGMLMNAFADKHAEVRLDDADKEYHRAYTRSVMLAEPPQESSVEVIPLLDEEDERGDPNVPTRKQIKSLSEKIVEERAKLEE